jgi:hypothetical protein
MLIVTYINSYIPISREKIDKRKKIRIFYPHSLKAERIVVSTSDWIHMIFTSNIYDFWLLFFFFYFSTFFCKIHFITTKANS